MHYMKPEHVLNFFTMFTRPTSTVEFNVNDTNAVLMMVEDDNEVSAATLISIHENAEDANTAKGVYESAFKIYREGIATMSNEDSHQYILTTQEKDMNEKIKIQMTLEDAIVFSNSTASVNDSNELLITVERNGVTETKIISSHATAEEALAEKAAHEKIIADFKNQVVNQ
ncbi:hypothetical protein [Buttiauxella noackiae]|uniref:hypothetical protein n=1 Tax=Buttiauxella noackiae TaxID=82992 RepID=UPI0005578750|nr:hypothetical protein [Buttiauxella noackiae]